MVDSDNNETKIASMNFSMLQSGDNTIVIKTSLIDKTAGGSLYTQVANGFATSYIENTEYVETSEEETGSEITPLYISGGVEVSTWSDFVAKVQDPSVTAINVMASITNDAGATTYVIPSKDLVIDGNGNTIDFGSGTTAATFATAASSSGNLTISNAAISRTGTTGGAGTSYFMQVKNWWLR